MTNINIGGDQINQHGNYNIGKVDQSDDMSAGTLSTTDREHAIAELSDFLRYLEYLGLVTSSGQLTDSGQVEAEIVNHRSKLQKAGKALRSGGAQALSAALNYVAAPTALELIKQNMP